MPYFPSTGDPIDPKLFALKWDAAFEVLGAVILLSFVFERALAPLFESRLFVTMEAARNRRGKGAFRPLVASSLGSVDCVFWKSGGLSP